MDSKFDWIDDDFSILSKRLADSRDEYSFAGVLDEIADYLGKQKHARSTENESDLPELDTNRSIL